MAETKTCSRCKQQKDVSAFGPDRRRKVDGLKSVCRPCDCEIHRERFLKLKKDPNYQPKSRAEYMRARYDKRRANGICYFCPSPAMPGKIRCEAHDTKARHDQSIRGKKWIKKAREEALDAYGGPVCVCCGEDTPQFLTLDHINNDGAQHRRKLAEGTKSPAALQLYSWLRLNGYPPGFQVLCYNCNCGKHRNKGICPHKAEEALSMSDVP